VRAAELGTMRGVLCGGYGIARKGRKTWSTSRVGHCRVLRQTWDTELSVDLVIESPMLVTLHVTEQSGVGRNDYPRTWR